jgi:hypothetical protein
MEEEAAAREGAAPKEAAVALARARTARNEHHLTKAQRAQSQGARQDTPVDVHTNPAARRGGSHGRPKANASQPR